MGRLSIAGKDLRIVDVRFGRDSADLTLAKIFPLRLHTNVDQGGSRGWREASQFTRLEGERLDGQQAGRQVEPGDLQPGLPFIRYISGDGMWRDCTVRWLTGWDRGISEGLGSLEGGFVLYGCEPGGTIHTVDLRLAAAVRHAMRREVGIPTRPLPTAATVGPCMSTPSRHHGGLHVGFCSAAVHHRRRSNWRKVPPFHAPRRSRPVPWHVRPRGPFESINLAGGSHGSVRAPARSSGRERDRFDATRLEREKMPRNINRAES